MERAATPERTLVVHDLGFVEYEDGIALQKGFAIARRGGAVPDVLLLVEHPPIITLGRGATPENVVASRETLEKLGVKIHVTDRGGDVTYHGPGQVVGYPIVDLAPDLCDVRRYVGYLEEAMIRAAGDFGVKAARIPGWTGAWVGEKGKDARKLGAIGVHISRWITTHGFAFNVCPDLSHFQLIVPCGISEAGVTSLQKELDGKAPALEDVRASLAKHLSSELQCNVAPGRLDHKTVSVAILREGRRGPEALLLKRHPHRGGFWQPVTGTIEKNETPEDCARRELNEETGFDAPVEALDYTHSFLFGEPRPDRAPRIFQETAFWTVAPPAVRIKLDRREHARFAWLPVSEALQRVPFIGLKECLRRAAEVMEGRKKAAAVPAGG
ncbi:MAG TPA: lipoyl(octanoyl) transferase LipB [Myxococcales bacterium]